MKTFKDLKSKQKEWIIDRLREEYILYTKTNGNIPYKKENKEIIVNKVYRQIQERGIEISYYEIKKCFFSKTYRFRKQVEKLNKK